MKEWKSETTLPLRLVHPNLNRGRADEKKSRFLNFAPFFHKGKLFGSKSNKKPIYKAAELKPPSNEVISKTVEAEEGKRIIGSKGIGDITTGPEIITVFTTTLQFDAHLQLYFILMPSLV